MAPQQSTARESDGRLARDRERRDRLAAGTAIVAPELAAAIGRDCVDSDCATRWRLGLTTRDCRLGLPTATEDCDSTTAD